MKRLLLSELSNLVDPTRVCPKKQAFDIMLNTSVPTPMPGVK